MWCVAELNAEYIAKMEDVLKTYEKPYDPQEPVVCLDEKPVTLHADVRVPQAAKPGREARRDNEYKRCGTANVFCAVEPKAGKHFTFPTANRTAEQFAQVVRAVAEYYPEAQTIHLVMDNLNIHGCKSLTGFYGEPRGSTLGDRFTVHYTPKHGSWLNQAEIEIGLFSRQCLGKRRIPDLPTLRRESRAWNRRTNRAGIKINWKFDRKAARKKFGYTTNSFTRSKD
ncbi:MAG TPA: IS630 family transposase [Candidatus Acidoferrales bacterium]|nr:IS630 family transposase [Candidatus Acidoferrales bacterium]